MAEQFYTILTNAGKAKIANALPTGQRINLTKMKVGDSNGAYYNPSETQVDIKHKVYECNITSVEVDKDNPNWVTITSAIPSDVGGFMIREVGVYDDTNTLIAIGKYPETYKPVASDGSTKELYIKMTLEIANASSVELKINPDVILATKKDVENVSKKADDLATSLAENAKLLTSFGTITGVTDDYATLMNAHSNLNAGDVLLITRPVMLKTPVLWTKKIDIQCIGDKGYFIADVGSTNDAFTIKGMSLNSVNLKINIYGLANCCKNALVTDCVNLSTINAKIKAGAVEYGFVAKGNLLTTHNIHISNNYSAPLVGAVMPTNHMLLSTGTATVTESNASKFNVKFEGGGNGIIKTNTSNLTGVEFTGTMEGLTGKPFDLSVVKYFNINNLYLEANTLDSVFTNCITATMQTIRNNTMKMKFVNTTGISIDGYVGSLEFDSTCTGKVKSIALNGDTIINNSVAVSIEGMVVDLSNPLSYGVKNIGENIPENLFHNPYIDIWSNGDASAPDGWTGSTITWAKESIIVSPINPKKLSAYCQQTGTTITDGAHADLKTEHAIMTSERWVSITLPLYVAFGQPDLYVYIYDTSQFRRVAIVTEKDTWVTVCGSAYVGANKQVRIYVCPYNGAFVAGNYYIGGLSVVNGNSPSKYLLDNGKRNEHVVSSVSYAPAFMGQRAYLSGTAKWYMAKGTTSSGDWIILN